MHIVLIYGGGNDLGRAYCLWLLAQELGWSVSTFASNPIWIPLAGTGFQSRHIERLTAAELAAADAAIVYQPVPGTLGLVLELLEKSRVPFLIDYDDPHWEASFGYNAFGRARVVLGLLRRGRSPIKPYRLRQLARQQGSLAASPFAGDERSWLVPHVRKLDPYTPMPSHDRLQVGFIGTPAKHKGIDRLREVVASVDGIDLWVTADAPANALAHEHWVGTTTLAEGRAVLNRCHISAVLQNTSEWSRRQFPVKVVDAMMAGRVVLASDVPPVRWALNDTGVLVPPDDRSALFDAITHLRDTPGEIVALGAKARDEAAQRFTPEVVAPILEEAVRASIATSRARGDKAGKP